MFSQFPNVGAGRTRLLRPEKRAVCWIALAVAYAGMTSVAAAGEIVADTVDLPGTGNNQTSFTAVNFPITFTQTPMVFTMPDEPGGAPAAIRIRNVTTTGFEIAQVEPPGEDGQHAAMPGIPYIAMTPGRFELTDGTIFEAGSHDTTTTVFQGGGSFDSVAFSDTFGSPPSVLTMVQTDNNEANLNPGDPPPGGPSTPWLVSSIDSGGGPSGSSISLTDFQLAMDTAETGTSVGVTSDETIGYLAVTQADGTVVDGGGNTITYDAFVSANNIDGWDNESGNGQATPFNATFGSEPIAVATNATRDGGDGGWIRRRDLTASQIGLVVDEDESNDSERGHTSEAASVLAFSDAFSAQYFPTETTGTAGTSAALTGEAYIPSLDPNAQLQTDTLVIDKTALEFDAPFDTEISVSELPSGETATIAVDEMLTNGADKGIAEVLFELGTGLGDQFVPSTGGDGLEFTGGGDMLSLAAGIEPGNAGQFVLSIDVDEGFNSSAGGATFTLRQTFAPVPEPASIAIWSLIGIGLAGFGYLRSRRRK